MSVKIAIVGRPNVGKSTLFNRLIGRKLAIVHDQPGVTRDRKEAKGKLQNMALEVIDTAGYEYSKEDSLEKRMWEQTRRAIGEADVCLFLFDARDGIQPYDEHFADLVRQSGKPVILLANKCEGRLQEDSIHEAYRLGLGEPIPFSAEHGLGLLDLYEALKPFDKKEEKTEPEFIDFEGLSEEEINAVLDEKAKAKPIQLAIVGRPNVGKSTLVNALLNDERMLTGPEAGVTRDAITSEWEWKGRKINLVTLFALFPSWLKSMPKSGGWMNVIKVTLGFLELAFALKFLSVADLAYGWRILDRETFLALWIVLFALLGFYLLGKVKFPHDDDDTKVSVPRFFMALASLAFAVYMLPGLWGAPLKAVSAFAPPMQTQDFNLYNNEVHAKFDDYDLGMEYARQHGKPVMLDFTGYGCVNCRKMELAVWTDPKVSDIINNDYVLITLYVDNKTPLSSPVKIMENGTERTLRTVGDKWSYLQRVKFGANAQPFYVLIDNEGKPLNKSYSYDESIPKYIEFLQTGLENYKKEK